jgi:hypothetical protein
MVQQNNPDTGYYIPDSQEYIIPQQQPQFRPPRYEPDFDKIDEYGGIIKDLTDTDKLLHALELRLLGKKEELDGTIVDVRKTGIHQDSVHEYINLLRSIVNQNTHFTNFKEDRVINTLKAANYYINRWLMLQGDKFPRRLRASISFESMNLIQSSLFKANDATILKWTKGSFKEGISMNPDSQGREGGFFNWILGKKPRITG